MKNKHIKSLKKPITITKRLECYIKAKKHLTTENDRIGDIQGLCLILPMILWDLDGVYSLAPDNNHWYHGDVSIAFPEVTDEVIKDITTCEPKYKQRDLRLSYLDSFILKLTNLKSR